MSDDYSGPPSPRHDEEMGGCVFFLKWFLIIAAVGYAVVLAVVFLVPR